MRWGAIFGWGTALWLAAGVQANFTPTLPGALWLIGLAAGLSGGPVSGAVVGAFAGLFLTVLSGSNFTLDIVICSASGALAGLVTRRYALQSLVVALLTAALFSALLTVGMLVIARESIEDVATAMGINAGTNALLMVPLYLLVLLFSAPREENA